MDKTLEELKAEADVLGVVYSDRIGAAKLAEKIEAYYTSQSAGDFVKVKEEVKDEKETPQKKHSNAEQIERDMIQTSKKAAMETKIVTISSNDKRDNDVTTSVYLSMENQHFSVAKYVPLDIPVELEVCLIEVAKSTFITLHTDEIIDGKRTGNKTPKSVHKFTISYEEIKK
jgi:hypothetical protein